ncbi:MAG: ribosomal protein S18-alanine N-acetyltransferase [Candidatus Korobacteraceae bacterium]
MNIRLATEADLSQLLVISNSASSAAHWSEQQWLDIFRSQSPARLAWIAEQPERRRVQRERPQSPLEAELGRQVVPDRGIFACGFLVAQCGGAEWELENIAVLPALRRRGVGAALLGTLLEEARRRQAERILLEVRASNQSAIRLYIQAGFQLLARRRDYYQNPGEDALLFGHPH